MTEFEWHPPVARAERALGRKRLPKVECPECGHSKLVLFRRTVTDWSATSIRDRLNPFSVTPTTYRLRWSCRECGLTDEYDVDYDPMKTNTIEQYDPNGHACCQTTINNWGESA